MKSKGNRWSPAFTPASSHSHPVGALVMATRWHMTTVRAMVGASPVGGQPFCPAMAQSLWSRGWWRPVTSRTPPHGRPLMDGASPASGQPFCPAMARSVWTVEPGMAAAVDLPCSSPRVQECLQISYIHRVVLYGQKYS
jgi:hypothetical protein